jgi:ADP-heptose:LPS heptosyltransferase
MYHDLVSVFNTSNDTKIPEIKIILDEEKRNYIENLPGDRKKIVIHPGVSRLSIEKGMIKSWPAAKWAELIEKLLAAGEYTVILTGGPDDREIFSGLRKKIDFKKENLLDLSEKNFRIEEFAYIVKCSDMLVCVDSAPMHIGVGLKKPLTAIFGPTDEKKLLPAGNNLFTPVKNDRINCRPCLWDKRQTSCEKLTCLDIEVERVFSTIAEKFVQN